MKSTAIIFLCFLLAALLTQTIIFNHTYFVDNYFWASRVENLAEDLFHGPLYFDRNRHAEHPAMPPLLLAALLFRGGRSAAESLRLSVTMLNALLIAGACTYTYALAPRNTWWPALAGGLLFNRLNDAVNPADVIMMSLTVLIFLMTLGICQTKFVSRTSLLVLGACLGAALSTRIHLALPLVVPLMLVLFSRLGIGYTVMVAVSTLAWQQALNPLMWYTPRQYLSSALLGQWAYVTRPELTALSVPHISFYQVVAHSPLMVAAVSLAIVLVIVLSWPSPLRHASLLTPWLSRSFLIGLILASAASLFIIRVSNIESARYYFPLILTWEVLFPLLVSTTLRVLKPLVDLEKMLYFSLPKLVSLVFILGNGILLGSVLLPSFLPAIL